MPIYEYKCAGCGHMLETIQKVSDAALKKCPSCGKSLLKKQITAAGFQLKGGGWYATDFKGSGGKPAPAPAPVSDSGGGETKTDGTPKTDVTPKKASGHGGGSCGCH